MLYLSQRIEGRLGGMVWLRPTNRIVSIPSTELQQSWQSYTQNLPPRTLRNINNSREQTDPSHQTKDTLFVLLLLPPLQNFQQHVSPHRMTRQNHLYRLIRIRAHEFSSLGLETSFHAFDYFSERVGRICLIGAGSWMDLEAIVAGAVDCDIVCVSICFECLMNLLEEAVVVLYETWVAADEEDEELFG